MDYRVLLNIQPIRAFSYSTNDKNDQSFNEELFMYRSHSEQDKG